MANTRCHDVDGVVLREPIKVEARESFPRIELLLEDWLKEMFRYGSVPGEKWYSLNRSKHLST
jgi:hypothetical protein